ncbi:MAG: hypothetical protein LBT05_04200 [Planctomycetaceae bacterium]|nr:hypothetical protein [Planctomycetaceae bacterium]
MTADDILAKSQEAMSQPLHYKMTTNGVEMSVYQKMLPDGKLALLMDMTQPIKKTTILYGNQSYDVFLEEQTAIDTGFMLKNVQTQAAAIFGANPGIKKNIKKKATLLRITGFHNRDCYDIETVLLPESFETVLKSLPPNMKQYFPVKERLMIDKQTYLIQKKNHFLQMVILLQKLNFKKSHINRR